MITCVIVDDEPLAIEILETYLVQIKDVFLTAKFTDSVEAFSFLQQSKIDIVFLDLNMPVLGGMELLKNLKHKPAIIITTAYREFAVEGFELDVLDYLVKPISFPRFLKAISKAVGQTVQTQPKELLPPQTENNNTLWLKVDKKLIPVAPKDILYIQSLKDYVRIVTTSQQLITYHTLQSILDKLPATEFVRIHKSYIVQVAMVESIEGNMVHIKKTELPIGRNYRKNLLTYVKNSST
jgi:two-component system, LytTR family, response regulator